MALRLSTRINKFIICLPCAWTTLLIGCVLDQTSCFTTGVQDVKPTVHSFPYAIHFVVLSRKILSLCNLHAHCWKVPVWVVCDGSDLQQSILLSAFCDRKSGWVTRSNVRLLGHWSYKQVEEYAVHVRKEHLSISRIPGHEVWKFILLL